MFCVDEKTAIPSTDSIRCCAARAHERHGFEYYRHGRPLYAAFNTKTGEGGTPAPSVAPR
ncbi:MAG: hypothetical protein U1F45_17455 [Burkholderiales bacterium]